MTSLLETASNSPDFKATLETAERLSSLLCGYGESDVNHGQQSSLMALDDDLWKELYLLPTPPLSPEGLSASDSNSSRQDTGTAVDGAGLYVDMMEYDQMMDLLQEAERVLSDSQQSYQQDLLLQDCMWGGAGGSSNPDGLLLSSQTPATMSIPSAASSSSSCTSDGMEDGPLCESETQSLSLDDSPAEPEPDCVEPSAVFPVLRTSEVGKSRPSSKSLSLKSSSSTLRSHTSMSSSESEEEIDVVTVETRSMDQAPSSKPIPSNSRQTSHHHSKKQLIGSSRHNATSNGTTSLRKKRHTKRLARRASEDGMESDEEARRASHNVLERKRRNDLKNSFDILRGGIPELEENLRAPKVVILRKAVEYIHALQSTDQKTKVDYNKEHTRHKKLTERLTQLRNVCSI